VLRPGPRDDEVAFVLRRAGAPPSAAVAP